MVGKNHDADFWLRLIRNHRFLSAPLEYGILRMPSAMETQPSKDAPPE